MASAVQEFSPGDLALCIGECDDFFTPGKIYVVNYTKIDHCGDIELWAYDNYGIEDWWYVEAFTKLPKSKVLNALYGIDKT